MKTVKRQESLLFPLLCSSLRRDFQFGRKASASCLPRRIPRTSCQGVVIYTSDQQSGIGRLCEGRTDESNKTIEK